MVVTFISKKDNDTMMRMVRRTAEGKNVIRILNGENAGTEKEITDSTLKRWWKQVEASVEEDIVEEENNLVQMPGTVKLGERKEEYSQDTESELTDEEYEQIGLEIAEQTKQKVKESKKPKKVKTPKIDKTGAEFDLSLISQSFEVSAVTSNKTNFKIKSGNKTIAELFIRKTFVYVCCKTKITGYEIEEKSYRAYPNYHKATSVQDINNILKEVV